MVKRGNRNHTMQSLSTLRATVKEHHDWHTRNLPLCCAENVMSPLAREFMGSDLHHRYPNYDDVRYYFGNKYIEQVEEIARELSKKLFRAAHVELHVSSGSMAIQSSVLAYAKPNDLVLEAGGKADATFAARLKASGPINIRVEDLPFDDDEMNLDLNDSIEMIESKKPGVVVLGAGTFLFPHPVKEIAKTSRQVGATLIYDGAHVLGLIAGRRFQDPLREGAEVMVGSTHKTFPGPQNGIILSNSDTSFNKVKGVIHDGLVSNHHPHVIAGIAVASAEMLEFGEAYASQVIENARTLARALNDEGLKIPCPQKGFTESHLVIVDAKEFGGGTRAGEMLDKAGIVITKIPLPWDSSDLNGLRLGAEEVTRLGMKKDDMEKAASFIARTLIKKEDPKRIALDIAKFRQDFQKIHYCFDEGADAYKYFDFSMLKA